MKSPVLKRSVVVAGRKMSVSLEDAFWQGLKDIATSRRMTFSISSPASISTVNMATSRRLCGCLCSAIIRRESVNGSNWLLDSGYAESSSAS